MDHVKAAFDGLLLVVLDHLEPSLLRGTVDPDETAIEVEAHAIFLNIFHQRRDIILDGEEQGAGDVKLDGCVLKVSVPEPLIAGEIKCLLRSAGAFDWHGGLREERAPAAKLLHKPPSVGCKVEAIVGRDAVPAKGLGK